MQNEKFTFESTNRRLRTSSTSPILIHDNKYSSVNNDQTLNLSYKAKKIIEKYNSKNYKNDFLNNSYHSNFKCESKENSQTYKQFIFEEGDDYNKLINKNKNLKRLFEQANCSLLMSLKKQEKLEKKYEEEKKVILDKLTNIQNKYEMYAESHQKMNEFNGKLEEITNSYNQLLTLYLKVNNDLKQFKDDIRKVYNNINSFIEDYYKNESVNVLSFEFLLHTKNEIKEKFNIKESNIFSNSKINEFEKKIFSNKLNTHPPKKHYNNDFTTRNGKIKSKLNKTSNIPLINKKAYLMNNSNFIKNKFIDIDEI